MKNLRRSLCVLILMSLFYIPASNVFAQYDDDPPPSDPKHIASVEQ